MVTDTLEAFAGPQCFAHLDPSSAAYRVRANERREDEEEDERWPGVGSGQQRKSAGEEQEKSEQRCGLLREQNWLRCRRCERRRFVDPACASLLRGEDFYEVRSTDLDWASWLAGAGCRYASVEAAQASGAAQEGGGDGAVDGEEEAAIREDELREQKAPTRGRSLRRRVRNKAVSALVNAGERAALASVREVGARPKGDVGERTQGCANAPDASDVEPPDLLRSDDDLRERSASDFECASDEGVEEQRGLSASVRAALDEAVKCVGGSGRMTREDEQKQRAAERQEDGVPRGERHGAGARRSGGRGRAMEWGVQVARDPRPA